MQFREAILQVDAQTYALNPNKANTFEEIYADFQQENEGRFGRWTIFLHPKQDVTVRRLELRFHLPLPPGARFLANGYQSWSETRMLPVKGSIPRLRKPAWKYMGLYGDEWVSDIPHGKGRLHSWTYTYIEKDPALDHGWLVGSVNERTGFTLILYDYQREILTIRKDMDGLDLKHSFPALDFWIGEGAVQTVYDAWFKAGEWMPPQAPPVVGWTSWYKYFNKISETIILENLESYSIWKKEAAPEAPSVFQIDDGWQAAVGDWLKAGPAFPGGMGVLAGKIKANGLVPGLWLSPFVTAVNADLVRRNPEWLLKDTNGKPIKAGWNPFWGGWFYALDFYQDGVREYLSGVFHRVLDQWGFELLKLDFLFAAALAPPAGKTRGGVMWEVMVFLRQLMGHRRMLACGVPLSSAFGLADYCRIGGDVHMKWTNPMPEFLHHRERVDTLASLRNTLTRFPLNGKVFYNDPDVFILREDHQQLKPEQQLTLLTINALLGGVLLTSDQVNTYSEIAKAELSDALWFRGSRVNGVKEMQNDYWRIDFEQDGMRLAAHCNLGAKNISTVLPGGGLLELDPWESLVLKC
ncbi:MAG: alpha-galactosidase [Saprospiraceae bacterium]|nr:alpha-galactosidase [Saprospiraceae bacterium]